MEFLAFTEKNKLVNTGMSALIDLDFFCFVFFLCMSQSDTALRLMLSSLRRSDWLVVAVLVLRPS